VVSNQLSVVRDQRSENRNMSSRKSTGRVGLREYKHGDFCRAISLLRKGSRVNLRNRRHGQVRKDVKRPAGGGLKVSKLIKIACF
jgi:Ni/Co efflux regulator RcnB